MTEFPQLNVGDLAPTFTVADQDGNDFSLESLRGQKVILYFYPAASTPGCTKEACDFNDNLGSLKAAGYTVIGISPDMATVYTACTYSARVYAFSRKCEAQEARLVATVPGFNRLLVLGPWSSTSKANSCPNTISPLGLRFDSEPDRLDNSAMWSR